MKFIVIGLAGLAAGFVGVVAGIVRVVQILGEDDQ